MLYDAELANQFATTMLEQVVYVVSFSFPVVPKGKARIRTPISATLTQQQIERALNIFAKVKSRLQSQISNSSTK